MNWTEQRLGHGDPRTHVSTTLAKKKLRFGLKVNILEQRFCKNIQVSWQHGRKTYFETSKVGMKWICCPLVNSALDISPDLNLLEYFPGKLAKFSCFSILGEECHLLLLWDLQYGLE